MLWSKRRSSLYNKNQIQQPPSSSARRTSLSANSSPRLPLAPLNSLDPDTAKSSLAAATDDMPSSSNSSISDRDSSARNFIARQIVNRGISDQTSPESPASSQPTRRLHPDPVRRKSVPSFDAPANGFCVNPFAPAIDPLGPDLYTYNSLNSFSFGSVQPQPSSSSRSINPLSTARDEADNMSDEFTHPTDVTPRPSVVAYHHNPNQTQDILSSHPAQPPGQQGWPPTPQSPHSLGGRPRAGIDRGHTRDHSGRDSDAASHRTFGTSSASASVTSLSDTSAGFSRTGSRASRHTTTTNQTSAHDLSSTDDEEDHHHPIPPRLVDDMPHLPRAAGSNGAESSGTGTAVEFSSDEEYADSEYDLDYDYDDEDGMNIEIGSAQYEGSVLTHDWEHDLYAYGSGSTGSVRGFGGSSERRGSLPMAIPGAIPPTDTNLPAFYPTGRAREDSLATLRRPSRSLDDEFRILGFGAGGRRPSNGSSNQLSEALNRPLPPAPISVPESDGDWRSFHERSIIKGKARERDREEPATSSPTKYKPTRAPPIPPPAGGSSAMEGFDLDWSNLRGGITTLDHSAVADIIRPRNSQVSEPNERRPSAVGSRWLPVWGNNRRPSTVTVSSFYGDSFGKAVGKWGGDGYQAQRRDWSFRREKADRGGGVPGGGGEVNVGRHNMPGFLNSRGSMTTERTGMIPTSTGDREQKEKDREREKEKEKESATSAPVWKGMALDAQEVWRNDLVGRYKVDRRANKPADPSKGPQQRLVVQHFRDAYTVIKVPHNGPPVTIHKHSKAIAFSISRHYRSRVQMMTQSRDGSAAQSGRQSTSTGGDFRIASSSRAPPPGDGSALPPGTKKSSSMILLAPRRVQEAFTSTITTRKLESHGLLDDRNHTSHEARDKERARRLKEREKEREREREKLREKEKQKEREREKRRKLEETRNKAKLEEMRNKGKTKQGSKDDSQISTSSTGSVASSSTLFSPPLQPPPASAPSLHTYPPGSTTTLASTSREGSPYTNRSTSRNSSHMSRRRRRIRDPLDDSDEDDEDAPPTRTPHNEAYGTMDANYIEQLRPRQERSHIADFDSNTGFLRRLIRGRTGHSTLGPASGQMEPLYDPPWLTMASRNKQEQQQRVVENLNTSFKDVGLLPSTHKDKPKRTTPAPQKQKKISSGNSKTIDIFEEVPADSLYMLLPLWPGDTDPVSERKRTERPFIPSENRQYLLVYYKLPPDPAAPEDKKLEESKKRSRTSPTSSHETRQDDRTSILLTTFHISARLVSYNDLQGSGVRVPDEGLSVTGPLDVAYRTMPAPRVGGLYDYVIGICHSREAGIEFYPDGLVKMGLCIQTSEPVERPESEEDEPPEPDVELTPVGRAVLEMAWLGGMALTSFGPGA